MRSIPIKLMRLANLKDLGAIPSLQEVKVLLDHILDLLLPGFYCHSEVTTRSLEHFLRQKREIILQHLPEQINKAVKSEKSSQEIDSLEITKSFLEKLETLQELIAHDVDAALKGDPAAKSSHEVIACYPCLYAITVYRIAHLLWQKKVPLIPRVMTEFAHQCTGIDIHPGAEIGRSLFIDHGTGVVIGETTVIGEKVRIYQGVTLGAMSFRSDEDGEVIRVEKRHPTIEDGVIIYAGATILGPCTIGKDSIIGGNVWITKSIPENTTVTIKDPDLVFKNRPQ